MVYVIIVIIMHAHFHRSAHYCSRPTNTYAYYCYDIVLFNRPKHPVKVHIWAGISCRGPTPICIFEGIMTADKYINILEQTLLPFLKEVYPDGHKFVQDNDPKHTAGRTQKWMGENDMNWW